MSQPPSTNPYQAPTAADINLGYDNRVMFYRDGKLLIARDGAELPDRCAVTNQPLEGPHWRKRKPFAWTPPWVIVLIFLSPLILIIVALCVQKKVNLTYSLSRQATRRFATRRWIFVGILLLGIGALFLCASDHLSSNASVGAAVAGVVLVLVGLVGSLTVQALKVTGHHEGWFRIKGCHPDFLDMLER